MVYAALDSEKSNAKYSTNWAIFTCIFSLSVYLIRTYYVYQADDVAVTHDSKHKSCQNFESSVVTNQIFNCTYYHPSISLWKLKIEVMLNTEFPSPSTMSRKADVIPVYKIIIIGDSGIGKTCLSYRFCCGKFPGKTEVTIGVDFREKCVTIDNEMIKLQLWDTAGQERFRRSMIQHYYRNVNAVVFVYDVTNVSSFDSLPAWISECEKFNLTAAVPRILIGNKCDSEGGQQLISTNQAQKFADHHNMPLFETSALDDSLANHVESIFLTLAHKLKACKPMMGNIPPNEPAPPSIVLHRADVSAVNISENEASSCYC